jgi:hypothetical protein
MNVASLKLSDFPDVDNSLLILAFTDPPNSVPQETYEVLRSKYQMLNETKNSSILVFYGDSVLNFIVSDVIRKTIGLNIRPGQIELLRNTIKQNAQTYISISTSAEVCNYISAAHSAVSSPGRGVNCGISFSAIIGALFVQYGLGNITKIENWILKVVPLAELVNQLSYDSGTRPTVGNVFIGPPPIPAQLPFNPGGQSAPRAKLNNPILNEMNETARARGYRIVLSRVSPELQNVELVRADNPAARTLLGSIPYPLAEPVLLGLLQSRNLNSLLV